MERENVLLEYFNEQWKPWRSVGGGGKENSVANEWPLAETQLDSADVRVQERQMGSQREGKKNRSIIQGNTNSRKQLDIVVDIWENNKIQ